MSKLKLDNVTLLGIAGVNSEVEKFKFARDVCLHYADFERVVILTSIPELLEEKYTNRYVVDRIKPMYNLDDVAKFFISDLHNYFDTDYVLTFQSDGFILNPDAWTDEFFDYDYIGAPWSDRGIRTITDIRKILRDPGGNVSDGSKQEIKIGSSKAYVVNNVGNGGFSFRSKRLMKFVAENIGYIKDSGGCCLTSVWIPDDNLIWIDSDSRKSKDNFQKVYISGCVSEDNLICKFNYEYLQKNGFRFAKPFMASRDFSVEASTPGNKIGYSYIDASGTWEKQFGFHSLYTNLENWDDKYKFGMKKIHYMKSGI